MTQVIAIDGPGGSGKSTVSRLLAERLGAVHLDTGAFYRAATLAALRAGVDLEDGEAVTAEVARHRLEQEAGRMLLDGEDVSADIRTPEVDRSVSVVSAYPEVRRLMVDAQRDWVRRRGGTAVVEGRDIGTVVFPAASLKVFLEASPEERARRRARESGLDAEAVQRELRRRDRLDRSRATSPLRPADDAVVIDTTELSVDEVVDRIIAALGRVGEASPPK